MRLRHVKAIFDEDESVEVERVRAIDNIDKEEVEEDTGLGLKQRNVRVRFRDNVVVGM